MTIEAMKQALAVLEEIADEVFSPYDNKLGDAILALRAAIEQAEKPRQWQGLTDEEIGSLWDGHVVPVFGKNGINPIVFARAIEAKLKEKNG